MYKLTLGSINELKASSSAQHGVFSGTIETDRVALVGDNGYLQVDGNFGDKVVAGLTRTFSKTLDASAIYFICEQMESENLNTADLYAWDGELYLQSDFATLDDFIEYLVDEGKVEIQGYTNPKYHLSEVSIKAEGTGYTAAEVEVTIPGETGDTAGVITVTTDAGQLAEAEITSAGVFASDLETKTDIPVGEGGAEISITTALTDDKYSITEVEITDSGAGYTGEVTKTISSGVEGDTDALITFTLTEGKLVAAFIDEAGSFEKKVSSQEVSVEGGTGKITVKMAQ